jgi:anti-anti-sigma regulatory factor
MPFILASDKSDFDEKRTERIRILAILLAFVTLFIWLVTTITVTKDMPYTLGTQYKLTAIGLLSAVFLFISAPTRHARSCVYIALFIYIWCLAFLNTASGTQGGSSWVLFQIVPPLAGLVLREKFASIVVAIVSMAFMLSIYLLQIAGIMAVKFLLPLNFLNFNLLMQIGTLIFLSIMTEIIMRKEREALQQAQQAQAETSLQLERVNQLLIEQKRLNSDLEESLLAIQMRDKQLAEEQIQRKKLHRTIATLSAPIVPIMEGVAVVPLVGSFDQERLVDLEKVIIKGIEKEQITTPIIDTTGISSVHAQFGQALVDVVRTCQDYSSQVIVVGKTPLLQELVDYMSHAKLGNLHVIGNLQEAIRYVINLKQAERKV